MFNTTSILVITTLDTSGKSITENMVSELSHNIETELKYMNSDALIGSNDFSVFSVTLTEQNSQESDIRLTFSIEHNDSDEDFSVDDVPVRLPKHLVEVRILTRIAQHLERLQRDSVFLPESYQETVSTQNIEVKIA